MTNTSAATTLFDHLARHAEQLADKTAFSYIEDNGDLSCLNFAQLDQQVNDLAKQLAVNTNQGDRVVLLLPQGMDYVVTFLACLRAGRVAVPLYPPLSRNQSGRVVKVVADCDAQLVITNQRLFESVNNALEQQISGLMCVNQLSEQMVPDVELPALAADDLAFLQYTSGSTGTPKGVMITHTNILANLQSLIDATNCNQQDVFCNWLPLFHDLGLINTLLLPAFLGAHSVLMSPARFVKRPAVWFEAIDNYRATICGAPNFAYDLCVKRLKTDKLTSFNLSSWRHAFTAAEPIDSDTLASFERKFAAIGFKPSAWLAAYGMAEATVFISANKIRSSDGVLSFDSYLLHQKTAKISEDAQVNAQKLVSCGRATPQHQLIIVDPKTLMPLPQGQVGEIWFAGPSVSIGYWQDQAKTQASFNCAFSDQQGQSSEAKYLRTGDAGFMHNGELFISGRLKDILIINGRNYYPQDIEKTSFESHEALVDFASVAFEHKGQVVLVQEVARKFLRQLDDDNGKIEQLLCQQIFEQFDVVVSDVVLLRAGQLPRTSSGKVQRSLTSQLYLAGELTRLNQPNHTLGKQAGIALQTDSEQRLGKIWCELLAVENVYANDNFFALGGQSVTALYLTERIFTEFAVELAPRVLFEYPELAELAAFIDGQTKGEAKGDAKVEADNTNSECSTDYLSTEYLASNAQRQIWLEQQMAPNSSRYHLVDCFELTGAIDVTRLQQAFGLLVANHGILRTCYQQTEQGLLAQIQQDDFDVLTVLPATDAAMDDFKARPFDLTKDIPLRAGLFLNAEERATLLIVGHHIAMDGGSYQRLIKDLNCFYQQGAIEVAANNDDFAQLVQLNQHSVAQHELTTAKNYWQQQLADLPLTHNLPMDYARAPSSNVDFRGDSYHLTLDSQLVTQLEQLAQSRNLSWFSLMHSAIAVLLRRHSGDDEVVLGITFDNRSAKARDIVGYFVNTLVTRSHIDFNTSFDDLLQTTFQQLTQAYAHSQLSFDALVELLNPPRVAGLNPLFQVLVGYDDSEQPELELAGVTATRVELPTEQVMTDLALHILRKSQSTQIRFDFATRLFKRETIENMANRLVVLLEAIVKTPEANVDQLPLLSASDKTVLAPEHDKIADVELLIERFQRQVAANPQQVALSVTAQNHSQTLTYLELDTAANRLAHYLIAQGVQREDRVAVCLNRRADLVVALLAIIKAGGAYVPLDASYPAERLSYMLTDADAKLVLTESDIDAALFSGCSKQIVLLDTLTQLDNFSQTSEGLPVIEPQQLAYVIYTSGSTGKPKGVMIEHRNVAALIEWAGTVYDNQALSKVLAVTSICFDLSVFELFVPLCHGGSVVLVKDALAVNADMAVSLVNTVPSVAKTWLATNALPKSAKIVNLAGELLAQSVVDSLYQQGVTKVYDLYGPSEDTTYSTYALRKINGRNTIGEAIAGTQALLLNSQGQMVPKGVVGELHLAGAGLARGYLNQPQLSAERFVVDEQVLGGRRYRTGDLMRIDGDGQLQYIGRNEHLVKIRGFRIELGEVEACIRRFAGIKDVVVIADSQAQQLAAYVVADGDELQGSLLQQLQQHLKQHLPSFMIPGDIIVLPHLPLTPNGKVDRSALPKATFQALDQHQIKAPQNPLEQQLLSIWQQLFDKQEISTDDNLFAIGGHSLLAAKMAWQISQQLKLNVGLDVVMAQQTIATQAQYLAELATNDSVEPWQKPDDAPLVLSAAQRRLWLIDNIEAEPSVRAQYNMPLALKLTGDLKLTALNTALNDLIKRYPVLRSRITTSLDGEPQLSYYADSTIELTVDKHADSEKWLNQQLSKPFDLSQDLLIRANVLALSANEHLLVLCVHHIVADGHSFNRLTEELTHLYKQQLYRQQPLAEVHSHYHDYVYVEAQQVQDNSKALDYWRQQLADLPQVHNLPLDFPRPVKALHQAGYHYQTLAVDVADKLKAVAQHHNQSLFTLIQSAFACVLARHSGQDDIVMGTPVLNRQDSRWADTLGFFADTQILRTQLPQNATFSELMTQNSLWLQQCLGEHRLTYDKLVDELAPERSLAFNPLFQILIVMQPQVEVELAGLEVTKLQPKTGVGKYDLTLTISQEKDQLQLSWEYDSGLFKTATIERMAGHLAVMLAAVADQPNMPIAQLPLLTANEQTQLQQWLTGQALQQPVGLLHQRFEQQAEATPNHIAVYHGDKDSYISYGELNRRANQLAHRLIADGVTPDTAVVICLDRQLALAVAVLAVLKAGGAYVAVDPSYPQSRIEHIIDDAGASFAITKQNYSEQSYTEQSYQALVNVNHCYLVDKPCWLNADEHNPEITALKPNHLAYMIYTSGSTGRPKGVMIEHQNAHAMVSWAQRVFDDSELACVLASTSMCFDLSIYEWFVPLSFGYSLALVDDALALTQAEFNLPITLINTVPSAIKALLDADAIPASVITVNLAGEPLAQSLVDKLYDAGIDAVNDLYGPSEDTTYSTWTRRLHGGSANIGQPIDGTEAVILDEAGIQVPQGVVGQLYLAGAGLSRGYWQQQALTEAAFSQYQGRRFYRTGDLVKLNDDGQICYLGRVDHQVKLRGFRIELGEIEAVLRRHPQIKEAVVIAKDNQLLAYLVADALTIEQARNWLEQSLPSYMVPNGFMLLAQLPLTANGKLDRKALPPMTLDTDHYRAPSNEIEQQLCQLWQQVLGREHIGIDDNFFSIGGDSIQSIQLISRAAQQGLYFSAEDLFTHQSIARLALVVKSSRTSMHQLAQPQSNQQILLPIQQRFIDGDSTDQHHYNQSILLDVAAPFNFDWLPTLVKATFDQQAVLRLRFNQQASHYVPFEADMVDNSIENVDLTEVAEADLTAAITQHCQQQQQGFDLANGPLFKAVYFKLADQADKLLLVAHHLIVDGVSWRILLQQWQLGVEQLQQQQAVEFTPVVHSYQQWGEQLQQWAQSDDCVADKAYWQQQLNTEVAALPTVDSTDLSAKTGAQTKQVKLQLSSEHSQMLLQQCDSAYHTQINDLLLCGLAIALQRFSGHSDFRIALESHGRHQLLPQQLDVATTMGWFTNLFPQLLSLNEVDDIGAAIMAVKEQLAATPHFGMSYGLLDIDKIEPQVLFNYLGQATLPADSVFSLCEQEFDSQMISPNRRAEFPLSFNGMIKDNRLNFVIDYDQSLFKQTSVERLANDYQQALQQIIEHCVSQTTSRFTPSDFPLAQVDDEQLVQLQQQYHGLVDLYAATPVQQGMLFHSKMHADAYVVQLQISLQGPLDLTQFKQAWQLVVKRHAVMRTAFVAEDQLQLVHQQVELNWQQLDWRDVADFSQQLSQWCIDDKAQGFAHDVAPLMRWCTMQISENRHVLVWSAHHALIDGWSLPVVFEEVLQAYHLLLNHQPVDLLPAAVYRHYIAWLSQQDKAQAEQFWQQYLAPVESQTQLMLHQQGLADAANAENQEISLQLAANQAKALLTLAQQHQVTLNTLIQGAWAYLLHRYSNEAVVCFGETVSGRPAQLPMVERMVGLFINSLPVRVDFSEPDLTLSDLLKQLHVDARERDNYGYLSLTDIQKLSALGNGSALFDSLLVFENYPIDQTMQAESTIQITDVVGDDQTNYGLTLVVMPQADEQLKFMLNYRSDKFAAGMANQLLTSFVAVLTDMLAGTDTVAELNVIAANQQLDSDLQKGQQNKSSVEHPSSLLVHQLFEQRAAIKPDAFVAYCEGRRLTYGELNRLANQLARRLVASGLQANQVVGLCVKRSVDILVGMLAILKAGGGYLPLDPVYPQARLDHMVQDAKVQHLVIESDLLNCVSHDNCDVLLLDDYDSRRMLDDSNIAPQTIGLAPNHLAYVIYTSGSTGQPKGVMIEHQAIAIHTKLWAEHIELQPQDKVIQFASISFDGAPESIFSSLYAGSELFLRENVLWSSTDFYQYCQQHQITVADLPPAFALNWLQTHSSDSEHYWRDSQLRLLCLGGDVLNLEIVRHLKHLGSRCRLVNAYGPTEATVTATTYELTGHDYDTSVPIGTALAERELYILDDAGRLMPPNTIGELYIGGDCLARGYLNQPQLTDERFVPDHFVKKAAARMYKTGDLVARAADGNLVFYGRCDGQVKVRGYRVELSEVEAVVLGHEHVEQAAVIYHQPTGQLVAYVSCHDNAPDDPQTWLRTELAESMPAHMVPALIYPVAQMPLTVSGKIDRKALPEPQSLALSRPYVAPEGETEQTLTQIFADLLGEPRVSATDSFFDIGGHSLLLGQLAAQLSQTFGLEVGIRDLYERQTIRAIAEWLDTEILLLGGLFADDDSEHDDETQTWEI